MNTIDRWESFAVISEKSDRYEWWQEVFGGDRAPIKSILSRAVILPGLGEKQAYELDLQALKPEVKERLVQSIAKRFNLAPETVRANLEVEGCPIVTDHVTACELNVAKFL